MNVGFILLLFYLIVLFYTIYLIIMDTHSSAKTLSYLLLVIILPVAGIIFYYAVGINYRHKRYNQKAVAIQCELDQSFEKEVRDQTEELLEKWVGDLGEYTEFIQFQRNIMGENLSVNSFELLVNGEEKFPEVLKTLEAAEHFIHLEYYAWENDIRGNQIKDVLIKKVSEGIKVRVLYDDYASRGIHRNIVRELKDAGVEIHPKIKIRFKHLANRMNHRNHRKIIIIDGKYGFVGGINLSDRYDNSIDTGLYWRDTHMKFSGPLVQNLQRHFIVSWNLAQKKKQLFSKSLFPEVSSNEEEGTLGLGQIMAGGPIYSFSTIMLTYFKLFTTAGQKLYITNPYFIPNDSILDALKQAALSGVDVRLLLPEKSDSLIVGAASRFYFEELLDAGVRIFLYRKGFVHAKTVVADQKVSIVGSANMDIRSFDLNFELMASIYSPKFAEKMEQMFLNDLKESIEMTKEEFMSQSMGKRLFYALCRLVSSFL